MSPHHKSEACRRPWRNPCPPNLWHQIHVGSIAGTRPLQGISPKLCPCSVRQATVSLDRHSLGRRFGESKCQHCSEVRANTFVKHEDLRLPEQAGTVQGGRAKRKRSATQRYSRPRGLVRSIKGRSHRLVGNRWLAGTACSIQEMAEGTGDLAGTDRLDERQRATSAYGCDRRASSSLLRIAAKTEERK